MNVRQLKAMLENASDDAPVIICGCYGSQGFIEKAYTEIEKNNSKEGKQVFVIISDICSG